MYFSSDNNIGQLYGTIWSGDATYIVQDLKNFLKGKSEATIHLHTPGGSVFDGNLIYNVLRQSSCKIHIIIDGLAASMGSILMLAGNTISMADNAFVMIHAPSGYVEGGATEMIKASELLSALESQFVTRYITKTGKDEKTVKGWLKGDNYFSAQKALENGLIDAIIDPVLGDIDLEALRSMNVAALASSFDSEFTPKQENNKPNTNKNNNSMKLNAKAKGILKVGDNATEDEINAAVEKFENMEKENSTLKTQIVAITQAQIRALIDPAIAEGKITAIEKEEWEQLAESNFELAQSTLAKLHVKEKLPVTGKSGGAPVADERKDWSFTDWSRKDTKGLLKMKVEDPERYNALVATTGIN